MKIVIANAGLANMMFSYALTLAFRAKGAPALLFVDKSAAAHHGYELERVFPNVRSLDGVGGFPRMWFRCVQALHKMHIRSWRLPLKWVLWPWSDASVKEPVLYYPEVFENLEARTWYGRQCQSWKYYIGCEQEIREAFAWNKGLLSEKTNEVAAAINNCNSVSIHIRRGDYLSPWNKGLGEVCDAAYLERAIAYIRFHLENPHFFIFSDDKEWVKENMAGDDVTIVDHNYGTDSWQDMYLMSQCKHQILANSSFSWWSAFLNVNEGKIIVAPKRWWAPFEHDDVVPDSWIRL